MDKTIIQCPICERQYLLIPDSVIDMACRCGHVLCSFVLPTEADAKKRSPVGECDLCHRKTWDGIDGETCGAHTQEGDFCLGVLRHYAAEQPHATDAESTRG
jgi:hypothetical protein